MAQARRGRPPNPLNPDASHAAKLAAEIRDRRTEAGLTLEQLADRIGFTPQYVSEVERAKATPALPFVAAVDRALHADGALERLLPPVLQDRDECRQERAEARRRTKAHPSLPCDATHGEAAGDDEDVEPNDRRGLLGAARAGALGLTASVERFDRTDAELEAIELGNRARSGDVSAVTLEGLEIAVHDLCRRYTTVPPAELLDDVRRWRRTLFGLLDARATLRQRRRLMVAAGWLSLLAACLHVDMGQHAAAVACRRAAHDLGIDTGDRQMVAWGLEVRAWRALLARRYEDAVKLCQAGRDFAGDDTSAAVQLTAQQARVCARLGNARETYGALDDAAAMCLRLPATDYPDHHFTFDPGKLTMYMGTTLAWLGDGKRAEPFAREVIDVSQRENRPGRLAMGRVDLALILTRQEHPEEACDLGHLALDCSWLAPTKLWRVAEFDAELRRYDSPATAEFHDHYVGVREHILANGKASAR